MKSKDKKAYTGSQCIQKKTLHFILAIWQVAILVRDVPWEVPQQTRDSHPMLFQCRASVEDAGPTLKQHRVIASCLLDPHLASSNLDPQTYVYLAAPSARRPVCSNILCNWIHSTGVSVCLETPAAAAEAQEDARTDYWRGSEAVSVARHSTVLFPTWTWQGLPPQSSCNHRVAACMYTPRARGDTNLWQYAMSAPVCPWPLHGDCWLLLLLPSAASRATGNFLPSTFFHTPSTYFNRWLQTSWFFICISN